MYTVSVTLGSGRVRSTTADTLADVVALTIGLVVPFVVHTRDSAGVLVPVDSKRIAHNRRSWLCRMVKRTGLSRALLTLSDAEFWRMVVRPTHYVHDSYDRHEAYDDVIEYARSIGGAELVEQVTSDPLYQMLEDTHRCSDCFTTIDFPGLCSDCSDRIDREYRVG